MILIFGGTTEGRLAVEVCEEAGKTFYYSTKSERQNVELHNGVRLSGAMTAVEIKDFCSANDVRLIIDAAHPFAEGLHGEIAKTHLPVVRLMRQHRESYPEVTYCDDFAAAVEALKAADITRLLALSGANTIARLKPYWTEHPTIFRILDRDESREIAVEQGLSLDKDVIYYNSSLRLPALEDEKEVLRSVGCDAIITKDSGESGGESIKIEAALQLGMKVFVVREPKLPYPWTFVNGRYGLRRAIENLLPEYFPLRTGLTTGACATAAVKAALMTLMGEEPAEEVSFALPDGEILTVAVENNATGMATVTKDFSDDPDVTRGCRITAEVRWNELGTIRFLQGEGVGRVTLPGLGIPVGEPAVNPMPRAMITAEITALTTRGCDVTISVENGRELAKRTFNGKVGVVDGISIIGTSGIVSPLSNDAFIQSIRRELQVARAIGCKKVGLVSGMKSEKVLQKDEEIRCVHYGNFVGEALKACHEMGFEAVTLGIMIGKAVKLAEGNLDTHSHKVQMNKEFLSALAPDYTEKIKGITMARELWDFMPDEFFDRIRELCITHCREVFAEGMLNVRIICEKELP